MRLLEGLRLRVKDMALACMDPKDGRSWPWQYVFLMFTQGFFLLHAAGQSLGLDGWIKRAPFGPFKGDGFIARLYRRFA